MSRFVQKRLTFGPAGGGGGGGGGQGGGGGGAGAAAAVDPVPDWAQRAPGPNGVWVARLAKQLDDTFPAKIGRGQQALVRGSPPRPWPFSGFRVSPPSPFIHRLNETGAHFIPVEKAILRDAFLWCPTMAFPSVFGLDLLPCPHCAHGTLHVKRKGWAPAVTAIDVDQALTLISQR